MYKKYYQHFFKASPELLHFAAHSHHFWPDVSREAHIQCWDDAARFVDDKWDTIFGKVVPEAADHISRILGVTRPQNITFAGNTHEFVARLFSCFDLSKPFRILTTDSEFHSFSRQVQRIEELATAAVERVSVEPFESFEERFSAALANGNWDLVYLSHVFFNSGFAISDLDSIVGSLPNDKTLMVVDGYHAFCALPVDLGAIEDRIFYLGGGYKYAQSGEGVCFMHSPAGCELRPLNTGWFASFGDLSASDGSRQSKSEQSKKSQVQYSNDAFRFFGATFDPSGLYRFNAVASWLRDLGLSVADVHKYVCHLQQYFLDKLKEQNLDRLSYDQLLLHDINWHGHFLTFRSDQAAQLQKNLRGKNIITDVRGNCLRFGFGLYHEKSDIDLLFDRVST